MTTIYILRHGVYKNKENVNPFRLPNFPLSNEGKKQMNIIANYLKDKNISAIYSSPILRTKQSAEIIGKALDKKINYSSLIIEVNSPFQGMDLDKFYPVRSKGSIYKNPDHLNNDGETIKQIYARMKKFLEMILEKHKGKNILIISHGDPIILLLYGIVEKDLNKYYKKTLTYIPKGGICRLKFEGKNLANFKQINY